MIACLIYLIIVVLTFNKLQTEELKKSDIALQTETAILITISLIWFLYWPWYINYQRKIK